ncbi:MAG: hypothetical protein H6996_05680 [Moraxellaceae bacterium]|nr:hypothetical protein [Pseudomonadales bacterium]MCP5174585.1 hypothetical protein [Moraxellaceae bacterium]
MLKYPNSTVDFSASPACALAPFQVYDREEWEDYLCQFDPNNFEQMVPLFNKYFFEVKNRIYTTAHKAIVVKALADALQCESYNFEALLEPDDDGCLYFPSGWKIQDYRLFFKEIYRITLEHWADELTQAGYTVVPLSSIP